MTWLVERLLELDRHLGHLAELRHRVRDAEALGRDLSLHNDVLFSLLMVCNLVIDLAGELAARHGQPYQTYAEAIRALANLPGFPPGLAPQLVPLAGFRNVLLHEYVAFDLERAVAALDQLEPVRELARFVRQLEAEG